MPARPPRYVWAASGGRPARDGAPPPWRRIAPVASDVRRRRECARSGAARTRRPRHGRSPVRLPCLQGWRVKFRSGARPPAPNRGLAVLRVWCWARWPLCASAGPAVQRHGRTDRWPEQGPLILARPPVAAAHWRRWLQATRRRWGRMPVRRSERPGHWWNRDRLRSAWYRNSCRAERRRARRWRWKRRCAAADRGAQRHGSRRHRPGCSRPT